MNQRPTGLNVTKAITGFLQYKSAEGLSPVTVSAYERDLKLWICLLYTSPSPRDRQKSRMPSSA